MAMTSVVVVIVVLSIVDNVDIPDNGVVVGELVCCINVLVVDGIGVGGHVRGTHLALATQMGGAVVQSCWG
jgi:hypothetical protein